MAEQNIINEEMVARTRALLEQLEAGDEDAAQESLDTLVRLRETTLYQELGRLTRELHDALKSFHLDARIADIAKEEIPDARERLRHVIDMTDKAANTTLTAVEESIPVCDTILDEAARLREDWGRFTRREMEAAEFRKLVKRVDEFLRQCGERAEVLRSRLNEVLMAQDFQDLTGQIIKRVITLVAEVEDNLVNLIRISGSREEESQAAGKEERDIKAEGPSVPGTRQGDVVGGQDEVDELLSSLGF